MNKMKEGDEKAGRVGQPAAVNGEESFSGGELRTESGGRAAMHQ